MNQLRLLFLLNVAAAFSVTTEQSIAGNDPPSSKLAFQRAANELRFDTGVLRGSLCEAGKSLGLRPLTHVASGVQLAGAFGILSPYRLLTADDRFGTAAWDWKSNADLLPDGAASVHWLPDKDHPLELTAVYRWSAVNALDLELTVKPQRDLRRFELFLASYFSGFATSLAYAKQSGSENVSGQFLEAVKAAGDWQTFPRDSVAVTIYRDGRWNRPPNPVTWRTMPCFAAPLAMRRDVKSGLTGILMSRPRDCFAVSMPYGEEGHRSVYLSLFGMDLVAGRAASAGVRLVVDKGITDDRAVDLYRDYLMK